MSDKLNVEKNGLGITPEEPTPENTQEEKSYEELQAEVTKLDKENYSKEKLLTEEDFNIKTYYKVNNDLYIKVYDNDDPESELFKILNPETKEVEVRELNDDEKKELFVKQLKESRKIFNAVKHNGNITTNQFGTTYKQKRKRKNKLTKKSRKANR